MKVKRYMGETKQEALEKVKYNLGKDAIILSSRKIRQRGLKGLFSRPLIEIVAAADDSVSLHESNKSESYAERINSNNGFIDFQQQGKAENKVINELDNAQMPYEKFSQLLFEKHINQLIDKEVQSKIAKKLIEEAYNIKQKENIEFSSSLENVILKYLGYSRPMATKLNRQKVVLFMGPTGVGKTTTLAKLAAIYAIEYNYDVGLITADTYRIAAIEQLKIYSDILNIPLEIVYEPKEITNALERLSSKDIIFIDTAGKSIRDTEQPEEINTLITLSGADEIFLCISASTSYQGCVNIIESYKFIEDYSIIYTKTDEVTSYGNIFNCCYISGRPMSYMTTGQNVPNDIKVLHPSIIKNNLIG